MRGLGVRAEPRPVAAHFTAEVRRGGLYISALKPPGGPICQRECTHAPKHVLLATAKPPFLVSWLAHVSLSGPVGRWNAAVMECFSAAAAANEEEKEVRKHTRRVRRRSLAIM